MKNVPAAKSEVGTADITRSELRDILAEFILWYAARHMSAQAAELIRDIALRDANDYLRHRERQLPQ